MNEFNKKVVIDTTLEEFSKNIMMALEKQKTKCKVEDFRSQYYDVICSELKKNINISQRVYDSIPDLHYWIYKHFEMIGYKVVELDWQVQAGYFEIKIIEAE